MKELFHIILNKILCIYKNLKDAFCLLFRYEYLKLRVVVSPFCLLLGK